MCVVYFFVVVVVVVIVVVVRQFVKSILFGKRFDERSKGKHKIDPFLVFVHVKNLLFGPNRFRFFDFYHPA